MALAENHVDHLPVVAADGTLDALVSDAALRAHPNPDAALSELRPVPPVAATLDTHVFDAAHLMRRHSLSVLPVVDSLSRPDGEAGHYVGLVVRPDVFGQLAHMLATEEPGTILVLDADRREYSLGQIAQLIEQSGVRILSVSTEDDPGAGRVRVTLKLNVTDTARVRHLVSHYGYRVVALFDEQASDLEDRAAAFLRYLDV